ncbi:hypothetical protein M0804_015538, partial [Polistes exclamans]
MVVKKRVKSSGL